MTQVKSQGTLAALKWIILVLAAASLQIGPAVADAPALIVVISVDQLRRDRLDDGVPGGLGRMVRQGRVFIGANLDHAVSSTCPGHAAILTGVDPGRAGIPGNQYVDRKDWMERYCFDDDNDAYRVIGGEAVRSPRNLRVTTLGDWMHDGWPGARVFAVGGKDRAVIAMGGHHPDGAFWFDPHQGKFVTSHYYGDRLPDYVRAFNGRDPLVDGFLARLPEVWRHDPGPWRPDDYPGENDRHNRHSPHPLGKGGLDKVAARFRDSPFQDTAVFSLARRIVEAENLGMDGSPDLLAVALSANDTVGHLYGPFSGESVATLRNVDRQLGSFIAYLDDRLGKGRFTIVLTADHGVAPLPEWQAARGKNQCPVDDGRVDIYGFVIRLYWYIYSRFTWPFGMPTSLVKFAGQQITVNRVYAERRGLDVSRVIARLKARLEDEPAVRKAWTRKEVLSGTSDVARLYRNSLVNDKSGDLFVQVEPGCVIRDAYGTGHGTMYDYDRDIPLVFYGRGVDPGRIGGVAHSIDIAPTLAHLVGLDPPAKLDGRILPLRNKVDEASLIDQR